MEAIKDIVRNVTRLLDKTDLFIVENPVGVESRIRDMIQRLHIQQSNDILLLGMWGMGGVGKTTIAKAIYNKIIGRNFEGRSFLANIREVWEQISGQIYLQEQLLFDICKETKTKIQSIESGKSLLKDKLSNKRVLLVLDDVSTIDQLNALCGSHKWLGSGSRIIITTRDMHILRGIRVDQVYKMKEMDKSESIELFSWHAFKKSSPKEDFLEISRNVVEYSGGLPLALEVLGSYLFDRGIAEYVEMCIGETQKNS
jgi:GTPase SAR1 family protein